MRELLVNGDLRFELDIHADFEARLAADVGVLRSVGLMDYSLMLWALKPEKRSEEELDLEIQEVLHHNLLLLREPGVQVTNLVQIIAGICQTRREEPVGDPRDGDGCGDAVDRCERDA